MGNEARVARMRAIYARAKAMQDGADAEGRELTRAEVARINALCDEFAGLESQCRAADAIRDRIRDIVSSRANVH